MILVSFNFYMVSFRSDYNEPSSKDTSILKQNDIIIPDVSEIVHDESHPLIIPDRKNETDILVMVMGQLKFLDKWYNILKSVDASISFVYASYDIQISQEQNATYLDDATFPFKAKFIPGTTWTQGRNMLAKEAVRLEKKRGKKFSHWLFMDDDINVKCEDEMIRIVYGNESCWQNVFNFISSSKVPENISTIGAIPELNPQPGLQAVSTADAYFAAFKREYVPYMLPYGKLSKGFSQWMSQAALFCIMRTCLESSIARIPYIRIENDLSRSYKRGLYIHQMKRIIKYNFVTEELGFENCMKYTLADVNQGLGATEVVPLVESEKFSSLIPSPELTKCAPMKRRFETWEKRILLA